MTAVKHTYNIRCSAITYASPGTIQFSCDTSHPVSEGRASQVRRAFFRPQSAPQNTPGNSGVAATLIKSEEGVSQPVRLSTETKAINKAPSAQLQNNCITACRRNTKLRRAKTALFGFDREHENIPDKRATSGHKPARRYRISCVKGNSLVR